MQAQIEKKRANQIKANPNDTTDTNCDNGNNCTSTIESQDEYEYQNVDIWLKVKLLVLQNIGIILGFMCMFVMALYSKNIEFQI